MTKLIEITIPILNEEKTLARQVKLIHEYISKNLEFAGHVKLVLADNGSNDCTPEIAKELSEKLSNVEYIRLDQPGVGRALKYAWSNSRADVVGYMDLDTATDLVHLSPALSLIVNEEADIVAGSRLADGAEVKSRRRLRTFTSVCFNLIVKLFFRTSFSDGMCGFKFMKRSILPKLISNGARSDGWFFSTELLIVAEYLGYKIIDLPVKWTDDPDSKVKIIRLALEYIKAMIRLRKQLNKVEK